jgi:hypothetical protein
MSSGSMNVRKVELEDQAGGGSAARGHPEQGHLERRPLIFGRRAGRAAPAFSNGAPLGGPRDGFEDACLQVEAPQLGLGDGEGAKDLAVGSGSLPLLVAGCEFRLRRVGRNQRPACLGNFGIEVLAEAVEVYLQAATQAIARGQADLADPSILQNAENSTKDHKRADKQPGKHGAPLVRFHVHMIDRSQGKECVKDVKL